MVRFIGGPTQEQVNNIKEITESFIFSEKFEVLFTNVLKLDVIYSISDDFIDIVRKANKGHLLNQMELKILGRILVDGHIIEDFANSLSKSDFEKLFGVYKNTSLGIELSLSFHEDELYNRTKIVEKLFKILWEISKNKYISNVIDVNVTNVENVLNDESLVLGEINGEKIIEIVSGTNFKLVQIGRIYKLYDIKLKELKDGIVTSKQFYKLSNGDIVIAFVPEFNNYVGYFYSLNSGKKVSPEFTGYPEIVVDGYPDVMDQDGKTIAFLSKDRSIKKFPYCLETQEFLDENLYEEPKKTGILSIQEIKVLLKGVDDENLVGLENPSVLKQADESCNGSNPDKDLKK